MTIPGRRHRHPGVALGPDWILKGNVKDHEALSSARGSLPPSHGITRRSFHQSVSFSSFCALLNLLKSYQNFGKSDRHALKIELEEFTSHVPERTFYRKTAG